jgi:plasmid stability protein
MAEITIRDLDGHVHECPREQTKLHQRSLGDEARAILDRAPRVDRSAVTREAEAIRRSLEGRYTGNSTAEIRSARDNDYQEESSSPRRVGSKGGGEAGNGEPLT